MLYFTLKPKVRLNHISQVCVCITDNKMRLYYKAKPLVIFTVNIALCSGKLTEQISILFAKNECFKFKSVGT